MISYTLSDATITEEKAAAAERFKAMKNDNWSALDGMTLDQLEEFEKEVNDAQVVGIDYFSSHAQIIRDAHQAIKHERMKHTLADINRRNAINRRRSSISKAAHDIANAIELVDSANAIDRDAQDIAASNPSPMQQVDTESSSTDELRALVAQCEAELRHSANVPDFHLIALLKTPAAKAIAKELKESADAHSARAESVRANLDAAKAEIDKREAAEREKAAANEAATANLADTISNLESRLNAIESRF